MTETVLPTCHVCGDLLPDDKVARIHCQDCAHALGEMAESPERVGLDPEDNERGEY